MTEQRAVVSEIDRILGQEFKVLDHGFVLVVDYMGTDLLFKRQEFHMVRAQKPSIKMLD